MKQTKKINLIETAGETKTSLNRKETVSTESHILSSRQILGPITLAAPDTRRKARCFGGQGAESPHLYLRGRGSAGVGSSLVPLKKCRTDEPLSPPNKVFASSQVSPTNSSTATARRGPVNLMIHRLIELQCPSFSRDSPFLAAFAAM